MVPVVWMVWSSPSVVEIRTVNSSVSCSKLGESPSLDPKAPWP